MKFSGNLVFMLALSMLIITSCGENSKDQQLDSDIVSNNKSAEDPTAKNPEPVFSFEEPIWDFGKITEGEIVLHTFKFKNTGNAILVISDCQASCGCTTPKCDKRPVAPGEEGEIEIKFDSEGKPTQQTKNITITANTNPPQTVLTITGYVIPKGG